MADNLFEITVRNKYRFPFKGCISAEDLWDLTPAQLDSVYKALNREAKAVSEDSLMAEHTGNVELRNKVEIVKYIFSVKKEEKAAIERAAVNAEKARRIKEILADKQDSALKSKSEEELLKMLESLE